MSDFLVRQLGPVYRVGKHPDAWRRNRQHSDLLPTARFDAPLGNYNVIYAASSRYNAYLAQLHEFRPGPNSNLQGRVVIDKQDVPTQDPGPTTRWICKRFIGEAELTGQFLDLTHPTTIDFLRQNFSKEFERLEIVINSPDEITYAPLELTTAISNAVFNFESLEYGRIDGLFYRSRIAKDLLRCAIFDRGTIGEEFPAITNRRSGPISLQDDDLLRALNDCNIDIAAPLREGWTQRIFRRATRPEPLAASKIVPTTVYFATNRSDDNDFIFGSSRRKGLCYGSGIVEIPKNYRSWRSEEYPKSTIDLRPPLTIFDEAGFCEALQGGKAREILIFIHGFNTSFSDALCRAALLKSDLQNFEGNVVVFSWPSANRVERYVADLQAIDASIVFLNSLLAVTLQQAKADRIHILAHSLGCRLLLGALEYIHTKAPDLRLENLVFAAPDVDSEYFMQRAEVVASSARSTTLYVSDRDWALRVSEHLSGSSRAGYASGMCVADGITTVDVSSADTFDLLGHNYIGTSRNLLGDIDGLLRDNPPDKRFGLRAEANNGSKFWRMD
jgi:pimeloyl-ACP methyl ester carboxylesterase